MKKQKPNPSESVNLSDIIAPSFYPVYWDVQDGLHTYYDLYGGRGSTKSSFIGTMIPLGIMQDPNANAIAFRKVASTISTSILEQCIWGVEMLGVKDLWKITVNPQRMTYLPTGQVILFRGLDKAKKMKSIKRNWTNLKGRRKSDPFSSPSCAVVQSLSYSSLSTRLYPGQTGLISTFSVPGRMPSVTNHAIWMFRRNGSDNSFSMTRRNFGRQMNAPTSTNTSGFRPGQAARCLRTLRSGKSRMKSWHTSTG